MANLTGTERARYVQAMFNRIAHRYDTMNRLMTAGQDLRWRREVIRRAGLPAAGRLLDLGAGTGDLAQEALRQHPDCRPTAADFTLGMMYQGRQRPGSGLHRLECCGCPAFALPRPDLRCCGVRFFTAQCHRHPLEPGRAIPGSQTGRAPGGTGHHPPYAELPYPVDKIPPAYRHPHPGAGHQR